MNQTGHLVTSFECLRIKISKRGVWVEEFSGFSNFSTYRNILKNQNILKKPEFFGKFSIAILVFSFRSTIFWWNFKLAKKWVKMRKLLASQQKKEKIEKWSVKSSNGSSFRRHDWHMIILLVSSFSFLPLLPPFILFLPSFFIFFFHPFESRRRKNFSSYPYPS